MYLSRRGTVSAITNANRATSRQSKYTLWLNYSITHSLIEVMKMQKKSNLPTKICVTCGRPFTWRKKWEKVWEEVKYCSDRCRNEKK
jgi:hypothetical protein